MAAATLTATAPPTPYRVKALLSGDMARANFRVDVAALQEQLGECASADGPLGAEHAPVVLFGERAAYFSITGVIRRLHARPWRAVRWASG